MTSLIRRPNDLVNGGTFMQADSEAAAVRVVQRILRREGVALPWDQ